jgi:polyphosphate kinase
MRDAFLALVEREIEHAKAGRPARIVLKMNALIDRACVEALYRASAAGVDVELIVRGACTLVPQVEGLSERIRVRSIVGEFLEHSRIWRFENGGQPSWFIGSADLMDRNLDRRIEAFVPIDDRDAQHQIDEILDALLRDDRRAWTLSADGRWQRVERVNGVEGTFDAQQLLKTVAISRSRESVAPRPHPATVASLEPWV